MERASQNLLAENNSEKPTDEETKNNMFWTFMD